MRELEPIRPVVSVDVVLLSVVEGELCCLLARRSDAPFAGHWALPGVALVEGETLAGAATRALQQRAGVVGTPFLEQLYTFDAPERDPRGRTLAVAHYALVHADQARPDVAAEGGVALASVVVEWAGELGGPVTVADADGRILPLAFDHALVIGMAVQRIRGKLDYSTIGFELLPEEFPLRDLQRIHEAVLGRPLNRDSFRRRMLASGLLADTGRREQDAPYRPAALYRFAHERPRPATPPKRKERP